MVSRRVSEATAKLDLTYVEANRLSSWLTTSGVHPLALISFGHQISFPIPCPTIMLDLPQLEGSPLLEVWTSDQPVETRVREDCSLAMSGDILAGTFTVHETPGTRLDVPAELAYRQLLQRTRELGFPYLWRAWNFFPGINSHSTGLERYQQFCVGRHHALAEMLVDFPVSLPAGTAVGTQSGPLQVYFLAGAHPAAHLGNPRQVNAYEYPKHYGPCSPSFARATLCRFDSGARLFIAGTASVVGHTSRHAGRPAEQTRETLNNLRTLLEHADAFQGSTRTDSIRHGAFKVYVRNPAHLCSIRQTIEDSFLASSRLLFLQGDLCREDLLVEIEGLVTSD